MASFSSNRFIPRNQNDLLRRTTIHQMGLEFVKRVLLDSDDIYCFFDHANYPVLFGDGMVLYGVYGGYSSRPGIRGGR